MIDRRIPLRMVFLVLAYLGVAGCAGFQVFDAEKHAAATAIKSKYATVDVLGTLDIQRRNLAALRAEESKVVQDNLDIQRKFALLEIVDNDTPMGKTWVDDVFPAIQNLGFEDVATLRTYVQSATTRKTHDRQLSRLADKIQRSTFVDVPPCENESPLPSVDALGWPPLDNRTLERAKKRYERYRSTCTKLLDEIVQPDDGDLPRSRIAWETARNALKEQQQVVRNAGRDLEVARAAHQQAVQAAADAGNQGKELRRKIKASADSLQKKIERVGEVAPSVVAEERISGLVALLRAAASDDADFDTGETPAAPDQELADAVLLTKGIRSLAADVETLVASAEAPSVSNLLIELQHQVVLLEHAQALAGLEQEGVDVLEAKYYAYGDQALELLRFHDALCGFGVMQPGKPHPGTTCDGFTVGEGGKSCTIADTPVANCRLEKPWKEFFARPPAGAEGREFYKGLAAFNALFTARAGPIASDFKMIDIQHRKNLASRAMALKAWNNLVAVPIDQIEAYYASGLKPAEVADLLVKALGLTAIAVGVSD